MVVKYVIEYRLFDLLRAISIYAFKPALDERR